ncbi:MAG: hypothetical protein KDD70_01880 [Bdellovibrionales bacterium]|nr:hypothetical protein [Bdellovibrionales bacterium]
MSIVTETFNNLPKREILEIASRIRSEISTNPDLVRLKDKKQFVTQADIDIQNCILDYFSSSPLQGKYNIFAEESLRPEDEGLNAERREWILLIDPIDGTSSFCRGDDSWGCMVGMCEASGVLKHSWNLLADGTVYSSFSARGQVDNWKTLSSLTLDVYDYGAGMTSEFPLLFSKSCKGEFGAEQVHTTSLPAAIWAGWNLYTGRSNGLLWIPSDSGKGTYPSYDLIFLGALARQGWHILLGRIQTETHFVSVAPDKDSCELLLECGYAMLSYRAANRVADRDTGRAKEKFEMNSELRIL